jgi:2-keto-3-deoxy-L-rhamnonate aldolase RhmA
MSESSPRRSPTIKDSSEHLRNLMAEDRVLFGTFLRLSSPIVSALVFARAQDGLDFVVVDCQHQAFDQETLWAILRMGYLSGVPTLVRIGPHEHTHAELLLDLGAAGIIFPLVNTKEEAMVAAMTCRYPPTGKRSVGGIGSLLGAETNRPVCIIQIEHRDALVVLDEILSVPGIDALLPGPVDLARSFGHDAAYGRVEEAMAQIQGPLQDIDLGARRNGLLNAKFYASGRAARAALPDECKFAIVSSDSSALTDGLRAHLADAKSPVNP